MTYSALISKLIAEATRPIFIWGAGIRPYAAQARVLAEKLGMPVACTWAAIDLLSHDHPLMAGGFGTHGTRAANLAVQNADLVISVGSRLDTKATGHPPHFARAARIVMVDLDQAEIDKFKHLGRTIDIGICADAGDFLNSLDGAKSERDSGWPQLIQNWRARYDMPKITWPGVNPYQLVKDIGKYTTPEDIICSDTGTALGYLMQGFPFKGERFLHAFNMTPMGYGLPAAIGASLATARRVVLITGDGSIMMSLSELATVSRWNLHIKIILLNNQGHAMCRQTQRQWLGGTYPATSLEGGLNFPDFNKMADAFDIASRFTLADLFEDYKPALLEIHIHPDAYLIPQARFGCPIEDQEPSLSREELRQQMIIPMLETA